MPVAQYGKQREEKGNLTVLFSRGGNYKQMRYYHPFLPPPIKCTGNSQFPSHTTHEFAHIKRRPWLIMWPCYKRCVMYIMLSTSKHSFLWGAGVSTTVFTGLGVASRIPEKSFIQSWDDRRGGEERLIAEMGSLVMMQIAIWICKRWQENIFEILWNKRDFVLEKSVFTTVLLLKKWGKGSWALKKVACRFLVKLGKKSGGDKRRPICSKKSVLRSNSSQNPTFPKGSESLCKVLCIKFRVFLQYVAWFLRTHLPSAKISKAQQLLPPQKRNSGRKLGKTLRRSFQRGARGRKRKGRGKYIRHSREKRWGRKRRRKYLWKRRFFGTDHEKKATRGGRKKRGGGGENNYSPQRKGEWERFCHLTSDNIKSMKRRRRDMSLGTHRRTQIWRKKRASASKCKMFF